MLTPDMRAVIEAAHLCFAATVTPEGRPNLSPKGTIRVWDDARLFFLDIASPGTRANLGHSPWMELNVVEQLSRRGFERIELDGPFATGTTGRSTITAGYTQEWQLTDVVRGRRFVITGGTPDGAGLLSFAWEFEDEGAGTRMT
jgi:hypothetical protein